MIFDGEKIVYKLIKNDSKKIEKTNNDHEEMVFIKKWSVGMRRFHEFLRFQSIINIFFDKPLSFFFILCFENKNVDIIFSFWYLVLNEIKLIIIIIILEIGINWF